MAAAGICLLWQHRPRKYGMMSRYWLSIYLLLSIVPDEKMMPKHDSASS
jgi:hypothetical protein